MTTSVTTQAELDAAIAAGERDIEIRSEHGIWLNVGGSASVSAYGSASVSASGSASVRAYGSASVSASGSASVSASGSASVRASTHVAVHLHSGHVTIEGGVIIDHTTVDQTDPAAWCTYHGAVVTDDHAVLYKAVRHDLNSARGFAYPIGETVACDDWRDTDECGNGLHASPDPSQAWGYDKFATRFLEVRVALAELRPITDGGPAKCKAPRMQVVREVDVHARPVAELLGGGGRT